MNKLPLINWGNWICKAIIRTYPNGRHAIELVDYETGEPIAVATINLPEYDISNNFAFIKNYDSIERGLIPALQKAGLVGMVLDEFPYGPFDAKATLVELTIGHYIDGRTTGHAGSYGKTVR